MPQLSRNFSSKEFECPHCKVSNVHELLVEGLQELRDELNSRFRKIINKEVLIKILSGYRCREHNRAEGGASDSQHIYGKAADIYVDGVDLKVLLKVVQSIKKFKGIGYYPQGKFIHVDVRDRAATWGQIDKKYVSLQESLKHEVE